MPFMVWNDNMSVGIASIDEQHKKLVGLLNELFDKMKGGKGKEAAGKILDELINYTATHFKYEEDLFEKTAYIETNAHKKEHKDLVMNVLDAQARYKAGEAALSIELFDFLRDWLTNHIMGSDKKYSRHFLEKGIK